MEDIMYWSRLDGRGVVAGEVEIELTEEQVALLQRVYEQFGQPWGLHVCIDRAVTARPHLALVVGHRKAPGDLVATHEPGFDPERYKPEKAP